VEGGMGGKEIGAKLTGKKKTLALERWKKGESSGRRNFEQEGVGRQRSPNLPIFRGTEAEESASGGRL